MLTPDLLTHVTKLLADSPRAQVGFIQVNRVNKLHQPQVSLIDRGRFVIQA